MYHNSFFNDQLLGYYIDSFIVSKQNSTFLGFYNTFPPYCKKLSIEPALEEFQQLRNYFFLQIYPVIFAA